MKIHPTLSAGAAPSCRTVGRLQLGAPTRRGGRPSNLLRNGIWMLALLATGAARGQVYEKLFSFTDANSTAQGTVLTRGSLIESALVEGTDGYFYGTTPKGGSSNYGTVFRMAPNGALTTLVQFATSGNQSDPKYPYGGLAPGQDGNFYGTTEDGGTGGFGTVFKVTPGGVLTVLTSFSGTGGNARGASPFGTLVGGGDGNFYGTTKAGGAYNKGTVFRVSPTGSLTTLVEFTGTSGSKKGGSPAAALLLASDGNFYGTTEAGGAADCGTVFRMSRAGAFATLVEFTTANANPHGGLAEGNDGAFYGTTQGGGSNDHGTAFRVTPAGALTTLANFAAASSRPYATLIHGGDGNFYGTTRGDALGNIAGTVFRMTPGGEVTTLVAFTDTVEPHKGAMPGASLVRGSDGYLYGSTSLGGATGWGTVFRMTPGGEMTTLVEFDGIGNPNKGITPSSALLQGTDGNFYGTTYEGGSYNFGTIYQMTPAGKLTTLVSFSLNERVNKGAHPYSGLIEGSDGCFYGTTLAGGSYVQGTVFKTTPAGDLTTLVEFAGGANGSGPAAGLVLAGDGNFYGATNIGGNSGFGTLYRVTPAGELTTLLSFTGTGGAHMGRNINAAMVVGPDGALYGTTYLGGSLDQGTIFRYTLAGSFTTLVEFGGQTGPIKGSKPAGSLMAAADGNFYGTTNEGGFLNVGTVFKMTPGGVLTTLHEFGFTDGWAPSDRLIQGPDGNIYGTTTGNTVFKLTPAGVLSNIFTLSFDPVDCFLTSGVTFGRDGNLYGVTVGDSNAGGAGSVFRLVYRGAPAVYPFQAQSDTRTSAVVRAKVNARGERTTTTIEYGTDGVTFPHTLAAIPETATGFQSTLVGNTLVGLTPGTTYHCRFRAVSSAGATVSPVISFLTLSDATAMPTPATEVRQSSARFNGIVNARHFDTTVLFEYGTDGNSFPNRVVAEPFRVTGDLDTPVSVPVAGLAKGTTYHYRIVASSAAGTTVTGSIAFRTTTEPTATVAGAVPLTSTSARVSGFVNPQGLPTQMVIEYGTDGSNFPLSVAAMPATADGLEEVPVSATLANLAQGETYYYRVRATSVGGIGWSSAASFRMATISGLAQIQPGAPPDAQGFLLVNLSPAQFQGTTLPPGWRFVGEHQWRPSGIPVGGLTTGNRDIEFRPVPGYIQPPRETVGVVSGEPATVVAGDYYEAAGGGAVGGLSVTLMPAALADPTVPVDERAQWRLLGEDDTKWRDSGTTLPNQIPGDYLVECKPVAGRATPPPVSVAVGAGSTVVATITYLVASAASGTQPTVLSFDTVTGSPGMPYAYAGQIRSRLGSSSGFVVKPRVVATAAHVVFDDGTLAYVDGLQWLFQRDRGTFEPVPQTPRGFYVSEGYAAQRTADASPGASSPAAQHLDFAALYFGENAGRGGAGGYLASDLDDNEFLLSSRPKLLVGYPVDGIHPLRQGRMHATAPADVAFARGYGRTFTTAEIRSSGGASGGPLCVQHANGNYYPAAIYLGGTGQTVVRTIDSLVIELFNRAEVSGNGGDNNTGGGITHSSTTTIGSTSSPGAVEITIQPAAAVAAGGGWRLRPETSYRGSGAQRGGLKAGAYILEFKPLPGFGTPAQQTIVVSGGQLAEFTYTYPSESNPLQAWRLANFGTTANAGPAADDADPDGDGQHNLAEFTAGTGPNDARDAFRVLNSAKTAAGFTVTAAGKAGRSYVLERRDPAGAGSWTDAAASDPLAADGTVTLTDPAPPAGSGMYRVKVTAP